MYKSAALIKTGLMSMMLAFFCGSAIAVGPVFWEISKQEDVIKGDARGVSIAENGTITLAPAFTLVYETKEAYVWSSATDAAGNIYLGTGHEGRIFKVSPSGEGRLLYDAAELDVMALTTDPQGNLYAGTSPEGKIYKITPDGKESVFYDPSDKYIWSLAFDPATSTLFAGTGDKGVIYKIDATGKGAVLADTNETNIVTLVVEKTGSLLAGTDPSGLLLRVSPNGKLFAMFDSPMQEIHSLAQTADGSIYALGISSLGGAAQRTPSVGVSSTTSLSSEGVVTISTGDEQEETSHVEISSGSSQAQSRSKTEGARTVLFRVLPDGGNEVCWRSSETVGYALKPLPDGRVLVGTGNKGRIHQIANRSQTLLTQSPEDQTSTIISAGDNLYATSNNLGRLYRIGRASVAEGTYVSPVRDTKFAGQWGVITWRGSAGVELQTRSGNTETPDSTWSEWSTGYRNASGDQITSPQARFLQWRAVLRSTAGASTSAVRPGTRSTDPVQLQSVVVAYLPRNQVPDIASVNVMAPGVAFQEMPLVVDPSIASSGLDPQLFGVVMNVPPRRFFQKGARTLSWQATDPNDDTLGYKVFYRTLGENEWHVLASDLSQNYYTIDGNRLPDGSYLFKIVVTDEPSNTKQLALADEQITDAIEIDNTPPAIKVTGPTIAGQAADVLFDATDLTSRIVRGEYSVDGGTWQLIFPADGIADSAHESFKVRVTFDKPGEHLIAFRCADSSSNVGTAKVTATVR
jgi:WD40 repeat protein